ncbi:hypothetical protein FQZ97_563510 [compost metagenome]
MMGRWMQKIEKHADDAPTKPTKPSFVGSVGTPSAHFQKKPSANDPITAPQLGWLAAVASLLEVGTMQLIEKGFVDRHDLEEQANADPRAVAALIKSNPRWHQC